MPCKQPPQKAAEASMRSSVSSIKFRAVSLWNLKELPPFDNLFFLFFFFMIQKELIVSLETCPASMKGETDKAYLHTNV